jgi:hypothetical protein
VTNGDKRATLPKQLLNTEQPEQKLNEVTEERTSEGETRESLALKKSEGQYFYLNNIEYS